MARPPKQNMLGSIHDWLQSKVVPQAPAGYEGILSSEEIKSARPGLLQSLIGTPDAPSPRDRYQQNLRGILEMKQVAGQMASQKQLAQSRQQIAASFPPLPENASPQQQAQRLMQMFTAFAQAGDTEMAGKMGEVLKSMGGVLEGPKPVKPGNPVMGSPEWKEAKKFEASLRPKGGDSEDRVLVQVQQPDGSVIYAKRSDAVGQMASGTKGSKATEGETAYGMFAARMASAETLLGKHESGDTPSVAQEVVGAMPVVGKVARNAISGEERKLYRQAQEDWVRAKLRKESGAAIGAAEMEDEINTYFAQPNDPPSVKAQKKERRQEAQRLMQQAAGRGAAAFETPKGSGSASVPDYETWKKSREKR
jgi:hypothetical protein